MQLRHDVPLAHEGGTRIHRDFERLDESFLHPLAQAVSGVRGDEQRACFAIGSGGVHHQMNRSLLARTRPEFYAEYIRVAREGGANETQLIASVAASIREAHALLHGKCPKCGAPAMTRASPIRSRG